MSAGNSPEVGFRMMRVQDIPEICRIEREVFTAPWSEQAFTNELTQNHFAHYVVMEHEGRVIGYAGMWIIVDEAHVTNIAVRKEYQGRKLGERLLAELMLKARRLGAQRMTLEVRVSNEVAQRLYAKFGFRKAGVRPGYYSDNNEDALIMWADLTNPAGEGDGHGGRAARADSGSGNQLR